jgi:NAD(P)-dependent dehydrogenase (short-subunit alcohol dehydrogenase family)
MSSLDLSRTSLPSLTGGTIAITGGASGIGRATAQLAARAGARVLVGDLNDAALAELDETAKIERLDIECAHLDVTDPSNVARFMATAAAASDPLTGLVCSAGISPDVPTRDMTLAQWNHVLAVNLTGAFLTVQHAYRVMVEHGHGGSVVTVGSAVGTTGRPALAHYAASKGGLVALTRSLALEFGRDNIRVNCVSPGGGVNTPLMWSRMTPQQVAERTARSPLRRLGQPEDVAYCIGFLLSDLSSWMTGQNLNVNGGSLMW